MQTTGEETHGTQKEVSVFGTHRVFSFIPMTEDILVGGKCFLSSLVRLLHDTVHVAACLCIKEWTLTYTQAFTHQAITQASRGMSLLGTCNLRPTILGLGTACKRGTTSS
jgi:hypothetical protein